MSLTVAQAAAFPVIDWQLSHQFHLPQIYFHCHAWALQDKGKIHVIACSDYWLNDIKQVAKINQFACLRQSSPPCACSELDPGAIVDIDEES